MRGHARIRGRRSRIVPAVIFILLCFVPLQPGETVVQERAGSCGHGDPGPDCVHTRILPVFNLTGRPNEAEVSTLRNILASCNAEIREEEAKQQVAEKIRDDDEAFSQLIHEGLPDDADIVDIAAVELHAELRLLDETGEAFDGLAGGDVTDETKLSTDLWADFTRQAIDSLTLHSPRNFLQPSVSSWVHNGMFSNWPYSFAAQLASLRASSLWSDVWEALVEETPLGHPPVCSLGAYYGFAPSAPTTSSNLVHQVFHTFVYHAVTKYHVWETQRLVVEFGGGFGALCNAVHSAGYTQQYILFDLPIFSQIQAFYLKAHGRAVRSLHQHLAAFHAGEPGVYTASHAQEVVDAVTAVTDQVTAERREGLRPGGAPATLFIAMWSLAEAPSVVRSPFSELIPTFDAALLGYHAEWGGIDNDKYAREAARAARERRAGGDETVESTVLELPVEISSLDRYWVFKSSPTPPSGATGPESTSRNPDEL